MEDTVAPGTRPAPPHTHQAGPASPEPATLTLQDLLDLPRQLLPEETYRHLQNATRETLLAGYTLWQHLSKSMSANSGKRVRKRIDVE
ncbi:MAG TPA: hypothetical protein VFH60_12180 [Chloroflexia bacterium]|nr:hypothetical protein [Chloroflexia bacterium]